jgi:phosphatidylglycerophosphatase A
MAFALFRLFDITKPGPIGWADRHGGAFWVMADDVLAGAAAALILLAVRALWPGLGL